MSLFNFIVALCALLIHFVPHVLADCQSFGRDFVNGGSYFINIYSLDYFNFTSFFEGCQPGDYADTAVILPNSDSDYCTSVPTTPNDTDVTAVCNVDTFELKKADMVSGEYTLLLLGNNADGPAYAYQRNIYITAGAQVTLTATPTVTFKITTTPEITTNTTQTNTFTSSLDPLTTTVPSTTLKQTTTVTPRATVYSTKTVVKTKSVRIFTVVETTKSVLPPCIPPPTKDVPLTALPPGLQNPMFESVVSAAAVARATAVNKREANQVLNKLAYRNHLRREGQLGRGLAKRSPDQPTVIVIETTSIVSITSTQTAPTITDIETIYVNTTVTYTPPVVTVLSGNTTTQVTVTAPTKTQTISAKVVTTQYVTKTIKATNVIVVTAGTPTPCGYTGSSRGNGPYPGGYRNGYGPYAGGGGYGPNVGGEGHGPSPEEYAGEYREHSGHTC